MGCQWRGACLIASRYVPVTTANAEKAEEEVCFSITWRNYEFMCYFLGGQVEDRLSRGRGNTALGHGAKLEKKLEYCGMTGVGKYR